MIAAEGLVAVGRRSPSTPAATAPRPTRDRLGDPGAAGSEGQGRCLGRWIPRTGRRIGGCEPTWAADAARARSGARLPARLGEQSASGHGATGYLEAIRVRASYPPAEYWPRRNVIANCLLTRVALPQARVPAPTPFATQHKKVLDFLRPLHLSYNC